MKKTSVVLWIISALALIACNEGRNSIIVQQELDSVPFRKANFSRGYTCLNQFDNSFLLLHSINSDSLLVYDVMMKNWQSIPISFGRVGDEIRSYCFLSPDSIFLMYQNEINIIDTTGNVLYHKTFMNPDFIDGHANFYLSDMAIHTIPLRGKDKVCISQLNFDHSYWDPSFFFFPVECSYSIYDSVFKEYSVYYPDEFKKHSFADAIAYWAAYDGLNSVALSFETSSTLCILDVSKSMTEYKSAKSRFDVSPIQPFDTTYRNDFNRIADYRQESPLYGAILFDPYRKCYYRFFNAEMPLQKENGTFNSDVERRKYLMILDSSFQVLDEVQLPGNLNLELSFVTEKGLHIKIITDSTQNGKNYSYFKVYSWDFF